MSSLLLFVIFFTTVSSMPCPSKCICKPMDISDVDFTRMAYLMDCSNQSFANGKFIYQAGNWSINEAQKTDESGESAADDYILSLDLSNSLSIKKLTGKTIQLSGFSFSLHSLHLTKQKPNFELTSTAFDSDLYSELRFLNLSTCCSRIPKDCSSVFLPLKNLRKLDLSYSSMYQTCLNQPDTISSQLTDLILRHNHFEISTFSNTKRIFNGIRRLSGTLDLRHSTFQISNSQEKICLFDTFQELKFLDLSSIKFQANSTDIEEQLSYLFQCEAPSYEDTIPGAQLLALSLRSLKLTKLPTWLNERRFPLLRELDLSDNLIHTIHLENFITLQWVFLAANPIEMDAISWHENKGYKSISLRSTITNRTYDLSRRLRNLLRLTTNVDYSDNQGNLSVDLSQILVDNGVSSLNISRLNIRTFTGHYQNLKHLDISFNSLLELDLRQYTDLTYLDCSNQKLNKLSINPKLLKLEELHCANNSLETIEHFSALEHEQLKSIDLANNSIVSLENLLAKLNSRYLRRIDLRLNSIELIPKKIFHENLYSLYEINLSFNRIQTIQTEAFQAPNLQLLDLRGNPLTQIEPRAILTQSLRLFYVSDDRQKLTSRCLQSNASDSLLSLYINWLKSNGTLMDSSFTPSDLCARRYINQTKTDLISQTKKHLLALNVFQLVLALGVFAILLGLIYHYREHRIKVFSRFRRYKKLDRQKLVDNQLDLEDDFTVMNLEDPPYTPFKVISADV